jgi:hypothetical protein
MNLTGTIWLASLAVPFFFEPENNDPFLARNRILR